MAWRKLTIHSISGANNNLSKKYKITIKLLSLNIFDLPYVGKKNFESMLARLAFIEKCPRDILDRAIYNCYME